MRVGPWRSHKVTGIPIGDGSRPSGVLRDGAVHVVDSLPEYARLLINQSAGLYAAGLSVGRIESLSLETPEGMDRGLVGTAFLIGRGFALTARHVAQQMAHSLSDGKTSSALNDTYFLHFGAEFAGERDGRPVTTAGVRLKIASIANAGVRYIDSQRLDVKKLDLAVLALEPNGAEPSPIAIDFASAPMDAKIAAIGFPANIATEPRNRVRAVFGAMFGFKRASSGRFQPLSDLEKAQDVNLWYIQHDASVLGGNSGSPIFRLGDTSMPLRASGVHVAGATPHNNYAVSLASLQGWLTPYLRTGIS